MRASFRESLALRLDADSQRFECLPLKSLSWSIHDTGTMFGAILVERFRTYRGRLFDLDDRSDRLFHSARFLTIESQFIASQFKANCQRLLDVNRELVDLAGDVSIVVLLSPGEMVENTNKTGFSPSCMFHLSPLPFAKLASWYQHGTPLTMGRYSSVPTQCWPTQIKSRSRLPYLLSASNAPESQPESLAVLKTIRGTIADTSVANLLVVNQDNTIASPGPGDVLLGCSLQLAERLLSRVGKSIEYRDILESELVSAREIILTGSSGAVWNAISLDGQVIGRGVRGEVVCVLTELWKNHVGIDFVEQAIQLAEVNNY